MNTIRRFTTQTLSFALAAAVTLAMLGGVNHLATAEHAAQGQMLVQQDAAARA
jgi:hypothetical protein